MAVTFDDGTGDFVDVALPVLERFNVPVVLYLATGLVESAGPLPFGGSSISWAGLRDACATGLVTVGSHTDGHILLDRVSVEAVADDLDRSIDLIGTNLGVSADHFAYPKAVAGSAAARASIFSRRTAADIFGCVRL